MSDPQVEEVCRRVPGWAGSEISCEPLEGGITNRNYLVTVDGERFVLRIPGADTDLLGIDRANEYRAASAAADAGVGPEVVAFLPDDGNVFVTRFVPGAHIPEEDLRRDDVLGAVVRSVRASTACADPVELPRLPHRRGLRADRRRPRRPVPPAYVEPRPSRPDRSSFRRAPGTAHDLSRRPAERETSSETATTCIVDYEYAGMGDPFFDRRTCR
jgi:hypothetical protein